MKNDINWKDEFSSLLLSDEQGFTCLNNAVKLKNTKLQNKKLYRYRSLKTADDLARIIHSIRSSTIYCVRRCDLNDPFELRTTLSSKNIKDYIGKNESIKSSYQSTFPDHFGKETIANAMNNDNWFEEIMKLPFGEKGLDIANRAVMPEIEMLNSLFDELFDDARIACFTEHHDNLPMWAHYTDNHKGVCLEYEISSFDKDVINAIYPVIYADELHDAVKLGFGQLQKQQLLPTGLMYYHCIQKLKKWEYEDEWRFVFMPRTKYNKIPSDYQNRGEEIVFGKPSKIILGNKISYSAEVELRCIAVEHNVTLTKMKVTPYGLEEDNL